LLKAYELYTGKKGICLSMGGGTFVHEVEGGVAFGRASRLFVNLSGTTKGEYRIC
jgi:succinyl-diaminopimelate desuccinylase